MEAEEQNGRRWTHFRLQGKVKLFIRRGGKVERDEARKAGYSQIVKGFACKEISLGTRSGSICGLRKYISI